MLFVGLHGLDLKKHMKGWHVLVVLVVLVLLVGSQGLKACGRTPFGAKTSLTSTLAFLLFLLSEFLRSESSLNETTMGLSVDVLVAGRTIQVPALMTLNVLDSHFQFETGRTSTSTKADGMLMAGRGFARMVFGEMHLETSVPEKVAMTITTTLSGFETPGVSLKEIGALFLATGAALDFFVVVGTSLTSWLVIGFPAVGTHVTGTEKPRQTGDDVVMAFLVEQDQLFGLGGSKRSDVKGTVCIHQDDLVVVDRGMPSPTTGSERGKKSQVPSQVPGESGRHQETIPGKELGQNCRGPTTIQGNALGPNPGESKTTEQNRTKAGVSPTISCRASRANLGETKTMVPPTKGETTN